MKCINNRGSVGNFLGSAMEKETKRGRGRRLEDAEWRRGQGGLEVNMFASHAIVWGSNPGRAGVKLECGIFSHDFNSPDPVEGW